MGNRLGDRAAKSFVSTVARGAMMATVGRIPVAGPILSHTMGQVLSEEIQKMNIVPNSMSKQDIVELLKEPDALTTKLDTNYKKDDVKQAKVLVFYFAAKWCSNCEAFDRNLSQLFGTHLDESKDTAVIFVSLDKNKNEQLDFLRQSQGDWPAVKYDLELRKMIISIYDITSIPSLLVINAKNGEIITNEGHEELMKDGHSAFSQWESSANQNHPEKPTANEKNPQEPATNQKPETVMDESMFKSALENPVSDDFDRISNSGSVSSEAAIFDREDIYGDEIAESGPQWTWLTNGTF